MQPFVLVAGPGSPRGMWWWSTLDCRSESCGGEGTVDKNLKEGRVEFLYSLNTWCTRGSITHVLDAGLEEEALWCVSVDKDRRKKESFKSRRNSTVWRSSLLQKVSSGLDGELLTCVTSPLSCTLR